MKDKFITLTNFTTILFIFFFSDLSFQEKQHVQQKRFVSSEGSLVQELNTLKRQAL